MKHLILALVMTLPLASAASAFSVDLTIPSLTFPTTTPVVASQACIQPAATHLRCN